MKVFIGKFNAKYEQQLNDKFYAGGEEGDKWYGGIDSGDYVFVSTGGKILALWKALGYEKIKNNISHSDTVMKFEEVVDYSKENYRAVDDFLRYKHFVIDSNFLTNTVKSSKTSFIEVNLDSDCPPVEKIEFKGNLIDTYVCTEKANIEFKDSDIRVLVSEDDEYHILKIETYSNGNFSTYDSFYNSYLERNKGEIYSIYELYKYSKKDKARNKERFLAKLINELKEKGYMKISNLVSLYDNVLVGRRRSPLTQIKSQKEDIVEEVVEFNSFETEEMEEKYVRYAKILNQSPNLIFYGPPGTGKTYSTEKLIDMFERKYHASSYKNVEKSGRVKNITFHQAYSYEEFIEGIRPKLTDNEESESKLDYTIEDGIFKKLCINASLEKVKSGEENKKKELNYSTTNNSRVWKISLGERNKDSLFNECIKNNEIAIGWLDGHSLEEASREEILGLLKKEAGVENTFGEEPTNRAGVIYDFINNMNIGDVVFVYDTKKTVRKIGIVKSEYIFDMSKDYQRRRKVDWIEGLEYPVDVFQFNGNKNLTMRTLYKLNSISISNVVELIEKNKENKEKGEENIELSKPYYIVIDEINRGNISKIFGELITLIEEDKREKVKLTLPYSQKDFTVPNNVYIIGTMNTSDRSIATIDTALRRRFTFIEIEPNPSILNLQNGKGVAKINNVDLERLLVTINSNILKFYDRNHRIGHSYFMGIQDLENLHVVWYYKILPLLQEYFYDDLDNLQRIIGENFFDKYGNVVMYNIDNLSSEQETKFEKNLIEIYENNENE